jgi:hypothetical protein
MADLTVVVAFTRNSGDNPATGLALADIAMYLTALHRSTGARTVVWDGTQNPQFEVTNTGSYGRILTTADLDTYNYVGGGLYSGLVALDNDWVVGSVGITEPPVGTALEFTYTVTDSMTGVPLEGVEIWVSTDLGGVNIVWHGHTDSFGVARDTHNHLPRLDPGSYYFWKEHVGYVDDQNPDTEVVS